MDTVYILETSRGVWGAYPTFEAAQDWLSAEANKRGFSSVLMVSASQAVVRNDSECVAASIVEMKLKA